MITWDGKDIQCDHDGCTETIPNHAWGQIKASDWFFTQAGKAYCPKHIPPWVAKWRERRKKGRKWTRRNSI